MGKVISFVDYTPPARFDSNPWTDVEIHEGTASLGPWTVIDTLTFTSVDADPSTPASRSFTTDQGSADELWYQLVFLDGLGNESQPTLAIQNIDFLVEPYATAEELARILKVKVAERRADLERVLRAAALEIDDELGRDAPFAVPPDLVIEVNLERAVEHWQQVQSPFGIIGLGGVETPAYAARDSWERHAHKLAPLKESWGIA